MCFTRIESATDFAPSVCCSAFVEFDCIETATVALQRISNYMGVSAAFSKNPLNVRVK